MKYIKSLDEKKPKGAPDFHHSDAPDAEGRFRDLGIKALAAWLIKTRKKDVKKISGSLTQQVVFNRNDDPEYAEKMEKVRKEVYKQLGRKDLLDKMDESIDMYYLDNAKDLLEPKKVYKHLDVEYGETRRGDKYVQIHYIPVSRPQSQNPEWVKVFYDNDRDLKKIGKELGMELKESVLNEEDSYDDYPAAAKKNAQMAIDWKEKYGRDEVPAGTPVGWARAHQLAKGEKISADTVKRMSAFNRHRKNSSIAPEHKDTPWKDRGYVAWLIWGGDAGVDWAMNKSKEIDAMKEAKELKHIKPLNEGYWSHYEYEKWTKENGKPKYPKWVKTTLKEIVKGGFMESHYDAEHNYMVLWLGSLEAKRRSELYAYDKKGKKEFGKVGYAMYQRFYNDLTGYNMFFMMGAMFALEVSKQIQDRIANGEPVEPAYYMMKEYFNNFGMDTKRSRIFNAAYEKLEKWMKDNQIKTL
tara:strand:+ start:321 stop:1721 length:1401 start_codon:yes stop_codon:yes gene_type:complete